MNVGKGGWGYSVLEVMPTKGQFLMNVCHSAKTMFQKMESKIIIKDYQNVANRSKDNRSEALNVLTILAWTTTFKQ